MIPGWIKTLNLINKFVFHALEFVNYIILSSVLIAFLPIVLVSIVNIYLTKKFKML